MLSSSRFLFGGIYNAARLTLAFSASHRYRSSQQAKRKPPLGLRINLRMKFLHQIFVLTSDIDAATWQVPGKQVGQLACGFAKSRAGSIV